MKNKNNSRKFPRTRALGYWAVIVLGVLGCESGAKRADKAPPLPGVVAAGTKVQATTQAVLSSRSGKVGDTLPVIVSRTVNDELGHVAIPAGSRVVVTIMQVEAVSNAALPDGQLSLVVGAVIVDAQSYPVTATLAEIPHHLEWRADSVTNASRSAPVRTRYRDVIVSAGTPLVFTLEHSLKVSAQ